MEQQEYDLNEDGVPQLHFNHVYVQRFWRAHLGAYAFSAWGLLISFNDESGINRAPSVSLLSDLFGQGDRYTLLGRAAYGDKPAQIGLFRVLEDEGLILIDTYGSGTQTSYEFFVCERVPLLTPDQTWQMTKRIQRHHRSYVHRHFGVKWADRYKISASAGRPDVSLEEALRRYILVRDGYACAYCAGQANTVDHIIPRSQGGDDDPHNLVAACRPCNSEKNGRTPEQAGMRLLEPQAHE